MRRLATTYPEIDSEPILLKQIEILKRTETLGRRRTLAKIDEIYALKPDGIILDGKEAAVKFDGQISAEFSAKLSVLLDELKAWRKGPFDFFGTTVDAEWRADLKFSRLGLNDLSGLKVADIGG